MKKISVIFYLDTFLFGGIEKTLITYLKYFDSNRFEVKLIIGYCRGEAELLVKEVPKNVEIVYIVFSKLLSYVKTKKILSKNKVSMYDKVFDVVLSTVSKMLYKNKAKKILNNTDVLIDYGLSSNLLTLHLSVPIISVLHFSIYYLIGNSKYSYKKEILLNKKIKNSSYIITLNLDMYEECIKKYNGDESKFLISYNPFEIEKIQYLSLEPLEDFNINNYIVTVCRLNEEQKDVTTLLKAFSILVYEYKYDGHLVIIGDGKDRNILEKLSLSLNIESQVIFLGLQSNPFKFIKNSKLFAYSSKFDGLPSVLIEAMIIGVPIVSTDTPTGVRDILDGGKAGYIVDIGNEKEMAYKMNELLFNKNVANNFLKHYLTLNLRFSTERSLHFLSDLIEKITYMQKRA